MIRTLTDVSFDLAWGCCHTESQRCTPRVHLDTLSVGSTIRAWAKSYSTTPCKIGLILWIFVSRGSMEVTADQQEIQRIKRGYHAKKEQVEYHKQQKRAYIKRHLELFLLLFFLRCWANGTQKIEFITCLFDAYFIVLLVFFFRSCFYFLMRVDRNRC